VITLVLGGTRSGKSAVAEAIAARTDAPVIYIATASADDDADLAVRIAAHRGRRPPTWTTVEAGCELIGALAEHPDATMLVDALGAWVAGHDDFALDLEGLLSALRARRGHTIVVSDEVGLGVHPSTEVGRKFRDALGDVHAAVAAVADEVLFVIAGRVLRLDRL